MSELNFEENKKVVKYNEITITNFKKIQHYHEAFKDTNVICGANGTGKTTIADAIMWLLFHKNYEGQGMFTIQRYNEDGSIIFHEQHEVTLSVTVDGAPMRFTKRFVEDWTQDEEGNYIACKNHNEYLVNDVPLTKREYDVKRSENICSEEVFRALSNPSYFPDLKAEEQKAMVIELVGDITNEQVAESNERFKALLESLNGNTIEEQRKVAAAQRKRCTDEQETIMPKIEVLEKQNTTLLRPFEELTERKKSIESEIAEKKMVIAGIDTQMNSNAMAADKANAAANAEAKMLGEELTAANKAFSDYKTEVENRAEADYKKKLNLYNETLDEIDVATQAIKNKEKELADAKSEFEKQTEERNKLYAELDQIEAEKYDDSKNICPVCGGMLPAEKVAEYMETFNNRKANWRKDVIERGKKVAEKIKSAKALVDSLPAEIETLKGNVPATPTKPVRGEVSFEGDARYEELYNAVTEAIKKANNFTPNRVSANNEELIDQKMRVNVEIEAMQEELKPILEDLHCQTIIEGNNKEIAALRKQYNTLAQEIANWKRTEDGCISFARTKIAMLEDKINAQFKYAKFRFLRPLVNGTYEDTCECTYNGVPYSSLNTAMRINIGLDICNALSRHHGVSVPIIIDNAEGVNKFIDIDAQLIALKVTDDKCLILK